MNRLGWPKMRRSSIALSGVFVAVFALYLYVKPASTSATYAPHTTQTTAPRVTPSKTPSPTPTPSSTPRNTITPRQSARPSTSPSATATAPSSVSGSPTTLTNPGLPSGENLPPVPTAS
jgi:hypothetical protein